MPRTLSLIVALAAASLTCRSAVAEDADAQLRAAVTKYLDAREPADVAAALAAVKAAKPTVEQAAAAVRAGRAYGPVKAGWMKAEVAGVDGKERAVLVDVPKGYRPRKPTPLIFCLHGGVSRPTPIPDEPFQSYAAQWLAVGHDCGAIMVFPKGTDEAAWWNATGAGQLLRILDDLKRRLNVDENRVFVTGFSDGGSGSYHMVLNYPTPFAGAVPLNGELLVSQVAGYPAYLANLRRTPLHVVNTELDPLYPAARVQQIIDAMKLLGVPVQFNIYPNIGHSPAYMDKEMPAIQKFLAATRRDPLPRRIDWECATPDTGRCDWIQILEIDASLKNDAPELEDTQVRITPTRVRLGVSVDQKYEGAGVKAEAVEDGSIAAGLGLQAGDVITQLDGNPVAGFEALVKALAAKRPGQKLSLTWKRGEDEKTAGVDLPPSRPQAVLARNKPSGRLIATAEGNTVTALSRGVRRYRVLVSAAMFDLAKPLTIRTNGKQSYSGVVQPDLTVLLTQARIDQDRTVQYVARIEVTVP